MYGHNVSVSDSGQYYLTHRGFVQSQGTYYYPGMEYPHLHAGLRPGEVFAWESTHTWIDARTGQERTRTGEQVKASQTIDFIAFHLAGEARARPIWSADRGWAADIDAVVAKLKEAGLFQMCQMVLNAFGVTRDTLPPAFKF